MPTPSGSFLCDCVWGMGAFFALPTDDDTIHEIHYYLQTHMFTIYCKNGKYLELYRQRSASNSGSRHHHFAVRRGGDRVIVRGEVFNLMRNMKSEYVMNTLEDIFTRMIEEEKQSAESDDHLELPHVDEMWYRSKENIEATLGLTLPWTFGSMVMSFFRGVTRFLGLGQYVSPDPTPYDLLQTPPAGGDLQA